MAKMTPEQAARAVDEMVDANFSPDEIEAFLQDQGIRPRSDPLSAPTGELGLSGTQKAAMFAGPAIGGFYGAQLTAGRNALPFLGGAGRALTQYAGEFTGIAAGDVAGRAVAGIPQNPTETLKSSTGGAALGSVYRGLIQAGGHYGNLPETVTQGAAEPMKVGGVPVPMPNLKGVSRAAPHSLADVKAGVSPEMDLVERASKAARAAKRTLTTQRMEKELLIRKADAAGVRIPVEPVKDALRAHMPEPEALEISEFRALRTKLNQAITMLDVAGKEGAGTVTPGKIDRIIRKILRPKAFTATGKPAHSMFADALRDAEDSSTDLLNKALPGDISKMNAEITKKLNETESAVALFGDPDKAGVSARISSAFNRNNEMSARALKTLSEHDKTLVDDAFDLYKRREIAGDIREAPAAGGAYSKFGGTIAEKSTRALAPYQRFVGGAGAGMYEAFKRAFGYTGKQ